MARFVGLDIGDKRIGVALSDPVGKMAFPNSTIIRKSSSIEAELVALFKREGVEEIVVGLPLSADGSKNSQCLRVENFCRRLGRRIKLPIRYVDEYLSSEEAKEKLHLAGKNSRRNTDREKGEIDAAAAAILLQRYLDSINVKEGS